VYERVARAMGELFAQRSIRLIYGGGGIGLMGAIANAAMNAGGEVVGVIPHALRRKELAYHQLTQLHVVDTMHERKAMMGERADAFIALPGGIGTLEELFEIWTWRQLGYHDKPVGILNVDGYYDALLTFLAHSVREGFMGEWQMDLVRTGDDSPALLEALVEESRRHPRGDKLAEVL